MRHWMAPTAYIRIARRLPPPIDNGTDFAFTTELSAKRNSRAISGANTGSRPGRRRMSTLIVIAIVVWVVIRIVQLLSRLWRRVDAESSPRTGVVAAAQG